MKAKRASLGKTTRPSLSGILPRKRLFALLDQARERSVVWVSGPPGCGKTTAVASAYGSGGTFMQCEYQMNTPMQGAGTCTFSNGARYRVHIGS